MRALRFDPLPADLSIMNDSQSRASESQPLLFRAERQERPNARTQETRTERRQPPLDTVRIGSLFASMLVESVPGKQSLQTWGSKVLTSAKRNSVILSYVLQNSIQTVSILVVGRLGPDELSAAAFSLMFAMVTG